MPGANKKLIEKDVEVDIGTPVYLVDGYDVIIICEIASGTHPITISWFRNGAPDPTRGNVSNITVTDATDGDVFTCMAENSIGFDMKYTLINVTGELMKNFVCTHVQFISQTYFFAKCYCGKINSPNIFPAKLFYSILGICINSIN